MFPGLLNLTDQISNLPSPGIKHAYVYQLPLRKAIKDGRT